jgi:hypothetical protein
MHAQGAPTQTHAVAPLHEIESSAARVARCLHCGVSYTTVGSLMTSSPLRRNRGS